MRRLEDKVYISGQLRPSDVPELKAQGVTMIVNNRPDGEDPDQPLGAHIEKAAQEAGIEYRFVPIYRGIGPAHVDCMQEAMAACDGKMVAFCRSGNRSGLAWAVARSEEGMPRAELEERAAGAGLNLAPVAHLISD